MKFLHEGIAMGKNKSRCECNTEREQTKKEIALKANFSNIKKKIYVLSGKGGVGENTASANFAVGLSINGYKG
jgi:Mrp family chromosome partitioning ATPase